MKYISIPICSIFFITFLLASCGGTYIPPKPSNKPNTQSFNMSYDQVWAKIIAFFGENNFSVEYLEKASGFIKAKPKRITNGTTPFIECGRVNEDSLEEKYGQKRLTYTINHNVVVRENGSGLVDVKVNLFSEVYIETTGWGYTFLEYDCASTGVLEASLFDFIAK